MIVGKGYEAFVASRKELHVWSRGQRRVIESVLIPCLVFVRCTNAEREDILTLPQAYSFIIDRANKDLQTGRSPLAVIPDAEMRILQDMLSQNDADVEFASSGFSVGDYVRVIGLGTDKDLAQIVRIPDRDVTYVGIRVAFLGCAYMQVPSTRIIKVKK